MRLTRLRFKPIPPDFAIDLYTGLLSARRTKLQPALGEAVKAIGIHAVDDDLKRLVPETALTHLASLGLRGERVFPLPVIIKHTPSIIGYYRMLLGLSQKEFGQAERLGYSAWVAAENSGRLSPDLVSSLDEFCGALTSPLTQLVIAMNQFTDQDLSDLSLLTLGSTLQGGRNNVIGSKAAQGIFDSIRTLIEAKILVESPRLIQFQSKSKKTFEVVMGSDPDIALNQIAVSERVPRVAIEVKGGRDASNAYNRAGEAEKSHISARIHGYNHRWTIIHLSGVDRNKITEKTPSSTEIFETSSILKRAGSDWLQFKKKFRALIT
jgi:hypothetical protein